jgi:hypothetical protein
MTPSALLQGATSIVVQNKQLRNEMRALEREIKNIRDHNNFMVSLRSTIDAHGPSALVPIVGDFLAEFSMRFWGGGGVENI